MTRLSAYGKKMLKKLHAYCLDRDLSAGDELEYKLIFEIEEIESTRFKSALDEILEQEIMVQVEDEIWFTDDGWKTVCSM